MNSKILRGYAELVNESQLLNETELGNVGYLIVVTPEGDGAVFGNHEISEDQMVTRSGLRSLVTYDVAKAQWFSDPHAAQKEVDMMHRAYKRHNPEEDKQIFRVAKAIVEIE